MNVLMRVVLVFMLVQLGTAEMKSLRTGVLPAGSRGAMERNESAAHVTADPDWYVWGASVMEGEDGKFHLFGSRWPKQGKDNPLGMRGWLYQSEIAHYVAERPEGPYVYESTVLKGFGEPQSDRWDAYNAHNPSIARMKDPESGKERYYLYYIANRDDDSMSKGEGVPKGHANDWWDRIINQRVGVAVADSLYGPWERSEKPVIAPPTGPLRHYLVNPGVVQLPDGTYLMCLKGRSATEKGYGQMIHGWALSKRPEGPFVAQDTLLFSKDILAEDPCVWVQEGYVNAAVKDWNGKLSGTKGIGRVRAKLSASGGIPEGGLRWEVPEESSVCAKEIRWDDGKVTKLNALERPFVLVNREGKPTHLYTAASVRNPFAKGNLPFNLCQPLEVKP